MVDDEPAAGVVDDAFCIDDILVEVIVAEVLLEAATGERENVCAATFSCEVKVMPKGLLTPAAFEAGTSCAWHATGKSCCAGSSFEIMYPKRLEETTGNELPVHHQHRFDFAI